MSATRIDRTHNGPVWSRPTPLRYQPQNLKYNWCWALAKRKKIVRNIPRLRGLKEKPTPIEPSYPPIDSVVWWINKRLIRKVFLFLIGKILIAKRCKRSQMFNTEGEYLGNGKVEKVLVKNFFSGKSTNFHWNIALK